MVRTTTLSPLEFIPGEYMCKRQPPTWRAYGVSGVTQGLPYAICPITPLKEFHSRPTLRMRKLRLSDTTRPASDRTGAGEEGGPGLSGPELELPTPRSGGGGGPGQNRWKPAAPRMSTEGTSSKGPEGVRRGSP